MSWIRLLTARRARVWVMNPDGRVETNRRHRFLPRFSRLK